MGVLITASVFGLLFGLKILNPNKSDSNQTPKIIVITPTSNNIPPQSDLFLILILIITKLKSF